MHNCNKCSNRISRMFTGVVAVLALLIAMVLPQLSSASISPPACIFYGEVLMDQQYVPVDTMINTWVDGVSIEDGWSTETFDLPGEVSSAYRGLSIPKDDPWTPEKDGAQPGDIVYFSVNGYFADQIGIWSGGGFVGLDLTASSLNANFSANKTMAIIGETIEFSDLSTGGLAPYTYEWDFDGDGCADSAEPNPSYSYDSIGVYTVTLVINDSAYSNIETKSSYITVSESISATFEVDKTSVDVGEIIHFTASGSGGFSPYTYGWDFDGDGHIDSYASSPSYSYADKGTYTVNLTVTDIISQECLVTKPDLIVVDTNLAVDFNADKTSAAAGQSIQFSATPTGGSRPYTYEWDFDGDGDIDSTDADPTYSYVSTVTYDVTLTVTDSASDTVTETKIDYIAISASLTADFSADKTNAALHQSIQFTDNTAGGLAPYTYEWDFDDDGSVDSTDANPSYSYDAGGNYTVTFTVTDSTSDTAVITKTGYITITSSLTADFDADKNMVAVDELIQFTDNTAGGSDPYTYEWDFDDDGSVDSTDANPDYSFNTAGNYTVKLTVTDSNSNDVVVMKTDYITVMTDSDTTPPNLASHDPEKDATDVPIETNIAVNVQDNGWGVDKDTIIMTVDGSSVIPVISGTFDNYTLTFDPELDFGYSQVVMVTVNAADLAGNTISTEAYSFTTIAEPDIDNPYISEHTPDSDATDVPIDTNITVTLQDDGWGIDEDTIMMIVDGMPVTPTVDGNPSSYMLTYDPEAEFDYSQVVEVIINAADLAGNAMFAMTYSFTTIAKFSSEPSMFGHSPSKDATGVPINTDIVIQVQDDDQDSVLDKIVMKIGDTEVEPDIVGPLTNCTVTYDSPTDFDHGEIVEVTIEALDSAGAVLGQDTYIFTTAGENAASASDDSNDSYTSIIIGTIAGLIIIWIILLTGFYFLLVRKRLNPVDV